MQRYSLAGFREDTAAFDAAVAATPGIEPFCSSSVWQLAALDRLRQAGEQRHLIASGDGAWLLFAESATPGYFLPFEASWGFASPVAGPAGSILALMHEAADSEHREHRRPLVLCLAGLNRGGELHRLLHASRAGRVHYQEAEGTEGMRIDLTDGVEAWLARRSRKFRRSLASAAKACAGIEIVDASTEPPDTLYPRILAIQQRTYKWAEGTDIFQMPEYAAFYRELLERLSRAGTLRALFAVRDGEDLAHVFGGVSGTTYRGLQMSYLDRVADLGLGNFLQLENLHRRAAEGITRYDLGMYAPYKERWADERIPRVTVYWAGKG